MTPINVSELSLVDLTKRGLEAHLQNIVLDLIVQEQLDAFEDALRSRLRHHITKLTIGHVAHVRDVLNIRDEVLVNVDVTMNEEPASA